MTEDNKKFDSLKLENQLCFPLYACARKIVNQYTPYLKPLGITYTQYIVFLVLWEYEPLPVGEIGKKLFLDNGTLTPLLKKMENEGYILRKRGKEDERVVYISLTDKGRKLKEEAVHIPEKMASCVTLPSEDALKLYEVLYKLLRSDE